MQKYSFIVPIFLTFLINLHLLLSISLLQIEKARDLLPDKKKYSQRKLKENFENILREKNFLTVAEKRELRRAIFEAEEKFGIPHFLLSELILRESSFNPRAISPVGARGLTQLMPRTAKYICNLELKEIYQIRKNILCGSKYLSDLLKQFDKDLEMALASYNMGPTLVDRLSQSKAKSYQSFKHLINSNTRRYVATISASVNKYSKYS